MVACRLYYSVGSYVGYTMMVNFCLGIRKRFFWVAFSSTLSSINKTFSITTAA